MKIKDFTHPIYKDGNEKLGELKKQLFKLIPFWLAGSVTAVVAIFYAKIFSIAETLAVQIFEYCGFWFVFISTLFFTTSWYLVNRLAPYANGSGIPQLMASIDLLHKNKENSIEKYLSVRIIVIKILSSLLGVLGGGAIGREGPTLQISGSIFSFFAKKWKFSDIQNRSAFIMAGAASGLASAFNTPLGGIVYVVEELAKSHLTTFRTGVLHAVIFSGIISQMIMGPYLYFGYPKINDFQSSLIVYYLMISLGAALIVVLFSYLLKKIVDFRLKHFGFRKHFYIAVCSGIIFGLYTVFVSENTLGSGKDFLNELLFKADSADIVDVLSRLGGTLFTYANGGAGGIFAPTLSIGGSTASMIDSILDLKLGPLSVMIGMTAGLSALTQSPLTSFILILEMSDRHRAIFPLMLAAITGHGVSRSLLKISFYEYVCMSLLEKEQNEENKM